MLPTKNEKINYLFIILFNFATNLNSVVRYLLFCLFVIFVACSKTKAPINNPIIEIDGSEKSLIPVIWDSILSEFFVLKLETPQGVFLGSIQKVVFSRNRIFISDTKMMNSVFIFDQFGQYINHLEGGFKGPGEFINPKSITVDFEKDELYVLDDKLQKIIHFNSMGQFIDEFKFIYTSCDISKIEDGIFAYNSGYPQIDNNVNSNDLLYSSNNGKILKKFLPLRNWRKASFFNKENAFTEYQDTTWYSPVYNDTIYYLKRTGPIPVYRIYMGNKFINDEIAGKINLDDPSREYIHAVGTFQKTKGTIYFSYSVRERESGRSVSRHLFFDLHSFNVKSSEFFASHGISTGLFQPPIATNGEYFVSAIEAFDAKRAIEWRINQGIELTEERMELFLNLSESDNPLLMFYKVAPF